ncbi:alkylation response protein AidB-like acyl-CoA dehydrogenase [Amycolatopsis jiangsuensis]|uniref:Alkylation response protein AidB-like acyl-CoA dehydrogenase n=1 Tax=Amycolatopsis jiangsuensis TaxID=1181879 RepID=A0A840IME8_9PSEU|nr:acyl-CoA dehydrogenase family protein [Amycolatopsis jiangsuensis]MBB4683120.1 alkylation response protein AidB-like acyl-CoA dehydrogenase [Amycolatopsis jiangsuensis]
MNDEDPPRVRREIAAWLADNLTGEFARLRGLGGPGREHEEFDLRLAWERRLAAAGWTCVGWPAEFGGRGLSLAEQVAFHEEYAASGAPARVNHIGEQLLGPTLIAFGTPEQRARFLPRIAAVEQLWCQGYSEPGAGSDLAAVATSAELRDGEWVVNGQKVWTSLAHVADWCFVLARTESGSRRHHGLSYLLVPLRQDGVTVRPIRQLTGTSEFNEVFFDDARTGAGHLVGEPGEGWRIAMATLGFERGVSTLGQQIGFRRELDSIIAEARRTGTWDDPLLRADLARARIGLRVLRAHALRTLGRPAGPEVAVGKLLWAGWHRGLGELALRARGARSLVHDGDLDEGQRLFLFTRADTLYGGSDEIERTIIAERVLGLPREART